MKAKITTVYIFITFLFLVVLLRALYIQVINREKLISYSDSQVLRKTKIYPKRGYILDRNGNPLAINVRLYNLFTFAKDSKKISSQIKKLKKIVPKLNYSRIVKNIKKRKGKFSWIKRKLSLTEDQVKKVKNLDQIVLETQYSRFYPNHEIASQVLGFVGIDNEGLAGIEYEFNDDLKGEAQIYKYYKDAKGRPVKFQSSFVASKAKTIELSIDKDIQGNVESYLKEIVEKHSANRAGAAVMDAQTGEIWAMANYPNFDPNEYRKASLESRKMSFVTDPFEPGSVFKTLTIASAMENKIVKPDTNYFCERGKYRVGNHYIKESDSDHAHEWLSVEDILKYSSNIGTTKIAFDVTYPTLRKTLIEFGIGEKTNIELPGESRGILDKKENIIPLRLSNISFGQGVATTGLQMMASYSPFANGGHYVQPTLLKVNDLKSVRKRRVISKDTSMKITDMLVKAVEDGTGGNARVSHFEIAGKTSTAQRVDGSGGYKGYVAGFLGYPVNVDKKFIVFVYVDKPKGLYYGNAVAAPVFRKIVKSILYKKKEYMQLARYDSKKVTKNMDKVRVKYSARRKVVKGIAPNLVGLDKTSTFAILEKLNIKYSHRGFGVVKKQYPAPGTQINKSVVFKIEFKAPAYE